MTEENKADVDSTDETEASFEEGIEKMTDVLDEAADKLYALAESLEVTDEELEAINASDAGKTQEEIDQEDALVAQIAGPIVDTLDAATAEIYGMTEKVLGMTEDFLSGIFTKRS
jgi:RNA processing factor Prp31